nr:putative transcription repressor ofp9 [Quercus suber]
MHPNLTNSNLSSLVNICGELLSRIPKLRLNISSEKLTSTLVHWLEEGLTFDRFASISSLAHAMVQERLDQMIRERQEARQGERRRQSSEGTKFIVMVALENCSYDPREDFRESMVEMIMTNRIQDPKDLRSLLNYYVSMNTDEYHGTILEVFHEPKTPNSEAENDPPI